MMELKVEVFTEVRAVRKICHTRGWTSALWGQRSIDYSWTVLKRSIWVSW